MGVLQTAILKDEFGKEDHTTIEGQSQERVAELYFWQKSEIMFTNNFRDF